MLIPRGSVRLIPPNAFWVGRASTMALINKLISSTFSTTTTMTGFCRPSQWSDPHRRSRLPMKLLVHDKGGGGGACSTISMSNNALSLKNCLDRHDHIFKRVDKAHVVAPYRHLAHDPELLLSEEVGTKPFNGRSSSKPGRPLEFLDQPFPNKLTVAVDVDEVLGSFLSALNKFIADRYSLNHSISEYHVYEFFKIWNCSRAEADIRVHEFFRTSYFKTGIHPIPGARHTLHKLSAFCKLSVVTSRQNAIKDHTLEWIEKHYPGLFQEIHFGNHFALDGQSRPKSEICRSLGAQVLVDDNPSYALECAEVGIRVLLFDYDNSYPWCKTGSATSHPLVTKVHNWQEVEHHLVSWAVSLH